MKKHPLMLRIRDWLLRGMVVVVAVLAGVGQAAPTSAAEWVQNFVPTELWSGPDTTAVSFGSAPAWEYFQVVSPQKGGRLHVLVARNNDFAFVDARSVGPSGPPPAGWPGGAPAAAASPASPAGPSAVPPPAVPASPPVSPAAGQALLWPAPGFTIAAERALWPALQNLQNLQHTWTLDSLGVTSTRLEWALMQPDAAGAYLPNYKLILINIRWYRSDPRALAAVIEHEAKHVADLLAGLDVSSTAGCVATEINAFREEAKTWGELVGPAGKLDPRDELEESLNFKLAVLQRRPDLIPVLIEESIGYRNQCHI